MTDLHTDARGPSPKLADFERAGFTHIEIVERTPLGLDDCTLYPLIPPQRQETIGTAIVVRAHRLTTLVDGAQRPTEVRAT